MSVIAFPGASGTGRKSKKRAAASRRAARTGSLAQDIKRQLNSPPEGFDIDFRDIAQLTEGAANESNDNPVVVSGHAELALRRLTARFGFDRLPRTYGELNGLLDYCFQLQHYASLDTPADEMTRIWRDAARKVLAAHCASLLRAFELVVAGDLAGLRELHRRENTLERLGREYTPPA